MWESAHNYGGKLTRAPEKSSTTFPFPHFFFWIIFTTRNITPSLPKSGRRWMGNYYGMDKSWSNNWGKKNNPWDFHSASGFFSLGICWDYIEQRNAEWREILRFWKIPSTSNGQLVLSINWRVHRVLFSYYTQVTLSH